MFQAAFGLTLRVGTPLPGLPILPEASAADVEVRLADSSPELRQLQREVRAVPPWYVHPYTNSDGQPILTVWKQEAPAYWLLEYSDGTEFLLDGAGHHLWASWRPESTLADTATYLLGPVIGLLIRLRGGLCLHASAVAFGGRAYLFLGPPQAGKSTTAAALAQRGCAVLSDDIGVLWDCRPPFLVQPAYPQMRLWPSSVQMLFGNTDALPPLTPTWDKRGLDLLTHGQPFQEHPLPLAAIYCLEPRRGGAAPALEEAPPVGRLTTLAQNTYVNYLLDRGMRAAEFEMLGQLVRTVPLKRAAAHEDPAQFGRFLDLLLEDFRRTV